MRQQISRHASAVVLDAEFEWQRDARLAAGNLQAHARAKRGGELDLAVRLVADRFGGVFHQVEEDLDELVAVREYVRQRWVIGFDEFDVPRKARERELLHAIEHHMDVHRLDRVKKL